MHISNDRYFRDRQRHDLALRMIGHEARTCTIKSCTGLTDDRIRRLYKTLAEHHATVNVRRRRGKSPRQIAFFTRNPQMQFESSVLASVFISFGLLQHEANAASDLLSIESGELFCDAYETHRQYLSRTQISFEHAWFLLQLLNRGNELKMIRCRRCHGHYPRDLVNLSPRNCPVCELKSTPTGRQRRHGTEGTQNRVAAEPCIRESRIVSR
jgi:hypothetical protein